MKKETDGLVTAAQDQALYFRQQQLNVEKKKKR